MIIILLFKFTNPVKPIRNGVSLNNTSIAKLKYDSNLPDIRCIINIEVITLLKEIAATYYIQFQNYSVLTLSDPWIEMFCGDSTWPGYF